jgi:hypothetical protein
LGSSTPHAQNFALKLEFEGHAGLHYTSKRPYFYMFVQQVSLFLKANVHAAKRGENHVHGIPENASQG